MSSSCSLLKNIDDSFHKELIASCCCVLGDSLLRKASSLGNTFILNHFQGTNPVQYNASGWLKVCRENPITKIATQVLQDSKK